MSPLPLARRYALPQSAPQPALPLSVNILDSGRHGDPSQTVTVTVAITVTEWRTAPQPTPTIAGSTPWPGMSRDALATSTETSEMLAHPTASGASSESTSTLRSGLVAGAVAGAVVGVLFVLALAVGYIFHQRRRCVRAALRGTTGGCSRNEQRSTDSTEGQAQRTRERTVRPYSLSSTAPPPSYDTLDYETETPEHTHSDTTLPEPAHLTKGASLPASQIVYMSSPSDGSRSPSTATSRETICSRAATASTDTST